MESNDKQFIKMTETPIPKLICSLSVPTIISMLVTAFYNTADTFFVSSIPYLLAEFKFQNLWGECPTKDITEF